MGGSEAIDPYTYYNKALQEQSQSQRWQYILDQEGPLDMLELQLKGFVYDSLKKSWKEGRTRLINDRGVQVIMTRLRSLISKNTVANKLEIDEIYRVCLETDYEVIDLLETYHIEWEVEADMIRTIVNLVDHMVWSVLKRSDAGTTIEFLQPILKFSQSDQNNEQPTPAQSSVLGGLFKR